MPFSQKGRWLIAITLSTVLFACQHTDQKQSHQQANTSTALTIEQIYQDKVFKAEKLGQIRWLKNGSGYTTLEDSVKTAVNSEGKAVSLGKDIVVYNPETLARQILVSASQLTPEGSEKPLTIDDYSWSENQQKLLIYTNSEKVWRSNSRGDYWVLDLSSNNLVQLGGVNVDKSQLMFAKFSPDASQVAYVYYNNIYLESLDDNNQIQLTHDTKSSIINGLFDWVYEEEFQIKDGFRWSPDGNKIAYWQLDTTGSQDFIMINNTDGLYPTLTKFPYPKVGETNALAKIGIINLKNNQTTWANLPNNSRDMYIPRMNWSGNSAEILIQHVNRKQNRNHLYLTKVTTGESDKIFTEKDEAFLDNFDDARWINSGNNFIWASERNGWRHLYNISRDGKKVINLTKGDFDIMSIQALDENNGWLYFIASKDNVAQRYLYRSKLDGSLSNQKVTPDAYAGSNSYQMSDNGSWAIHSHSSFTQPKQKHLVKISSENSPHQSKHLLLANTKLQQKLDNLNQPQVEFFNVKARDGLLLDGYMMRPHNFDENKKYPVIFYVYGEAWGQTVQDKWRGSSYLWDQYLTEQGYIVASIDNRGTRAPRGREWRKSIYGAVGVLSSRDQSDALNAMTQRWPYLDSNRIGIWGHSGGGSMTLNMLFRYPEQYHVGISSAPVADQRLYDTIYQERYSGLLSEYEQGYIQGSPITHAKNLQGKLLLVHGTGDDNVHYQGTERLINELVKHNRQFEFMSYPNRSHSLKEGDGTTLHYKTMKTQFFNEHLTPEKHD